MASFFQVGGCVRDELLDLPVHDRDWVVVGATVDEMLAWGFVPVGRGFPVFLHPHTHEEYALARTEKKVAPGYRGFQVCAQAVVSLAEDLKRRDITINAMAKDAAGQLIDPYGGAADLRGKVLRHVSSAFAEDPVRVLRIARFAARFPDFSIAPATIALMTEMQYEASALLPERLWREFSRALVTLQPARFFTVLGEVGWLAILASAWAERWTSASEHYSRSLCAIVSSWPTTWPLLLRVASLLAVLPAAERMRIAQAWCVPKKMTCLASLVADWLHTQQRDASFYSTLYKRLNIRHNRELFDAASAILAVVMTEGSQQLVDTATRVIRAVQEMPVSEMASPEAVQQYQQQQLQRIAAQLE